MFIVFYFLYKLVFGSEAEEEHIPFTLFEHEFLHLGQIKHITISREIESHKPVNKIIFTIEGKRMYTTVPEVDHFLQELEKFQLKRGLPVKDFITVSYKYRVDDQINQQMASRIFMGMVSLYITFVLYRLFKRSYKQLEDLGQQMNNQKFNLMDESKKDFSVTSKLDVRMKDVAGLDQAKLEINEFVDFMKNSSRYHVSRN
jgi:ATP-dependent Zn protease